MDLEREAADLIRVRLSDPNWRERFRLEYLLTNHPLRAYADLLQHLYDYDTLPVGRVDAVAAAALDTPPSDQRLYLLASDFVAITAMCRGQVADADRILDQRRDAAAVESDLKIRLRLLRNEHTLRVWQDRLDLQQAAVEQGLALARRGKGQWERKRPFYLWKMTWRRLEIRLAIRQGDCRRAGRLIARYESQYAGRGPTPDRTVRDMRVMRAWLCCAVGDVEGGLAHSLKIKLPARPQTRYQAVYVWDPRVRLLIQAGRFAEARRLIGGIEAPPEDLPPAQVPGTWRATIFSCVALLLGAELAEAEGDLAGARALVTRGLARGLPLPCDRHRAFHLLARCALAKRDPRGARAALHRIADAEESPRYQAEWARLYLLEGNEAAAALGLRRLWDPEFPLIVPDRLRWAHELSVADATRLLIRAQQAVSAPELVAIQPAHEPRPAPAPELSFVGVSSAATTVRRSIERFAPRASCVLVTGETGTGKEVVARLLHRRSPRGAAPFIGVNCGALCGLLIESELFGHVKGAFSGAVRDNEGLFVSARGGTLLLDDIDTLSFGLQTRLLRVLETGEVRAVGATEFRKVEARVVVTTNVPLDEAVEQGKLREDLFYRLARLHIHIPPLRERREDILALARHFLAQDFEGARLEIDEELAELIEVEAWPGNARELRAKLEQMVLLSDGAQVLTGAMFRLDQTGVGAGGRSAGPAPILRPERGVSRSTLSRRRRLLDLFLQHGRVTRGLAVRELPCARETAATDLKTLEQRGLIRRCNPGRHPHTAFYELA